MPLLTVPDIVGEGMSSMSIGPYYDEYEYSSFSTKLKGDNPVGNL